MIRFISVIFWANSQQGAKRFLRVKRRAITPAGGHEGDLPCFRSAPVSADGGFDAAAALRAATYLKRLCTGRHSPGSLQRALT
jgi:hypothetical protein